MTPFRTTARELTTARTRIRTIRTDDLDAVHAYQSDPESCRYLPYSPRERRQVAEFLDRMSRQSELRNDHDRLVFAIERTDGGDPRGPGAVIGELHLVLRSASLAELEVGWVLHPSVAGQGFATESATALVAQAFAEGAHRVVAELDPRNAASIALCRRLSMREEAHFVRNFRETLPDGTTAWADTGIYAVLAEEWAARG